MRSVSLELLQASIATFIVDQLGISWDELFGQLVCYKQEHGDCNVPLRWKENPQLAKWVSHQRGYYRKGELDVDRARRLNDLGFDWDPLATEWEIRFAELTAYKREHGDCNVARSWPENPSLGLWVRSQRRLKREGKLEVERIRRLDQLGINWDPLATEWENRFAELTAYKQEHGDCNVPSRWPENPSLGIWVNTQRQSKAKGKMDADRVTRLKELGFRF